MLGGRKILLRNVKRRFPLVRCGSSKPLNFDNTQISMKGKSNSDLLRALFVFSICRIRPLVMQSENLVTFSYKAFGSTITDAFMRRTFFGHFCAGETPEGILHSFMIKLF